LFSVDDLSVELSLQEEFVKEDGYVKLNFTQQDCSFYKIWNTISPIF